MTAQGQEIMNRLAILPETNYGPYQFRNTIAREIERVIGKEKVERTLQRIKCEFKANWNDPETQFIVAKENDRIVAVAQLCSPDYMLPDTSLARS